MTPAWCFDDANLSPPLDDSMSGIGADFVNSMFSMRDALSALPVCDDLTTFESSGSVVAENDFSSGQVLHNFQAVLKAPTSSATKFNEPPLTYLNQSQVYELVLQRDTDKVSQIKSLITLRFHEHQMELQEQEHLNSWREAHPGERLLDVDLSQSYGFEDLFSAPATPNMAVCLWNGPQCTVALRLNCIGTEFTAKKHGGEKGIPFRLQVDYVDAENGHHIECCATQVKVFRMKGADRKHRTDREKLERKSRESQSQYRPSCPVTTLVSFPFGYSGPRPKSRAFSSLSQGTQILDLSSSRNMGTDGLAIDSDESAKAGIKGSFSVGNERSTSPRHSTADHVGNVTASASMSTAHFVTPSQPFQRPTLMRTRRSSPGPSRLSPSPSRRLTGTMSSSNLQRRRRQRVTECCMGSCSACGRICRNPCGGITGSGGRWIRTCKVKPCCAHWDGAGPRQKQPAWLPEKRRASHSYERNSAISCPQKVDRVTGSTHPSVRARELSTSAESSLGNEELSKWTLVDKRGEDEEGSEDTALQPSTSRTVRPGSVKSQPQSATEATSSCLSNRDAGYSSDLVFLTDSDSTNRENTMKNLSLSAEPVCFQSHWEAPAEAHTMEVQSSKPVTSEESDARPTVHSSADIVIQQPTDGLPIHIDMTPEEVTAWFKSSNLANLADTFQTFSGRDMLRLTKEDFQALCGAVEGLRLHNAFYNKPPRPRSTIYLSRRENEVYQAVMLYQLTRDELLRHVSAMVTLHVDQVQMLCILTDHGLPVLITDELVAQLEDHSFYQLEVHSHCPNKANIFLRPA
ncbi:transcription factor CP2 [Clonorchis sinensis]|uniref:Transcription factor CP2 n=1 Tax=Clonorchis sinensis TaxID=79923 RepID=G7Y4M1_CLOSI|nr:transcription factor CP2 [Clonorchis sinensis]